MISSIPIHNHRERWFLLLLLLEISWMFFSEMRTVALHDNPFYYVIVDPVYWFFYGCGIPQNIIHFSWLGFIFDAVLIIFLLALLVYPANRLIALVSFLTLLCYYVIITGYLAHRNFQMGFVWVLIPFLCKGRSKTFALEGLRYFVLFFYASSALFKISEGSLLNPSLFSNILQAQLAPYFIEHNFSWRTYLNQFLVQETSLSYILYIIAALIELFALLGFFTRRLDRWIVGSLFIFHISCWILMDIAPIGQLTFIFSLLLQDDNTRQKAFNTDN